MTLRRQFNPLPEDLEFLEEYGLPWETIIEGSAWVLLHEFPTPAGYTQPRVTAAIRIETGYPQAALDMVYFSPALARKDGKAIGATNAVQQLDGKTFQRWSRHRTGQNPWKSGRDHLASHVLLIEDWLEREFEK